MKGKKEPPKAAPSAGFAEKEPPEPPDGGSEAPGGAADAGAQPAGPDAAEEVKRLRVREDELLRALAELQNVHRRRRQELDQALTYAHEPLVRALLPVLDDLERALAATEGREQDPLAAGVRIVLDQLRATLERDGVTVIRPANGPFDPELHDALMQRPAPGTPPHTVLEVVKPGYRYRGRVLRHAQVVVSEDSTPGPEAPPPAEAAPAGRPEASKPPEEGTS